MKSGWNPITQSQYNQFCKCSRDIKNLGDEGIISRGACRDWLGRFPYQFCTILQPDYKRLKTGLTKPLIKYPESNNSGAFKRFPVSLESGQKC